MILTRAFFARPRGGRHSHAPGCAPDIAGLSIERDEDVMVEDDPQRKVALSTSCCKWIIKLNSNSDVAPISILAGGLIFPRPGSIFLIPRLGSVLLRQDLLTVFCCWRRC